MLCPFLLTLAFGIFSLVLSFGYLLPLQAHALINVNCPSWLAWIVSVIFVLLESAILDILFFAIIVATFQDILFDATLKSLGMDRMFEHRVDVNGVVLCCRGMSSSVLLGLILVLAQVFFGFAKIVYICVTDNDDRFSDGSLLLRYILSQSLVQSLLVALMDGQHGK